MPVILKTAGRGRASTAKRRANSAEMETQTAWFPRRPRELARLGSIASAFESQSWESWQLTRVALLERQDAKFPESFL